MENLTNLYIAAPFAIMALILFTITLVSTRNAAKLQMQNKHLAKSNQETLQLLKEAELINERIRIHYKTKLANSSAIAMESITELLSIFHDQIGIKENLIKKLQADLQIVKEMLQE